MINKNKILLLLLFSIFIFTGCNNVNIETITNYPIEKVESVVSLSEIPEFENEPYVIINDNIPYFDESEITTDVFEEYSDLDELGRCRTAYANICKDLMPNEDRGQIGHIKPSGWHTVKYDIVDGKYLYNRCHLIGFQLAGENANEKNLITGTRYFNVDGMLPFENMVADYVKETDNHVLYRVTPIYDYNNLVANGVLMEAYSVEDSGDGICFNVYIYNNQPGITINYKTGESYLNNIDVENNDTEKECYIINTNSKKFHKDSCSSVKDMSKENMQIYNGLKTDLIDAGYSTCGICKP